jgi:DNA-binding YbaB/EbfC family protein
MNMQKLMQQAQAMQKEITTIQKEIENTDFTSEKELVKVVVGGNKKVKSVEFKGDVSTDDLEVLQDMVVICINDCIDQIDKVTEAKLGKYSSMMNGMF